jgi:hypothetical protein
MTTLLLAIVLGLFACDTVAQSSRKRSEKRLGTFINTWREGTITLGDRTELTGLIKYDDKTCILSYQNGDESRTFVAKSVLAFTFYDEATASDRKFYSLDFSDPEVGYSKMYFFEVIREYKKFAILSKTDPYEVRHKTRSSWSPTLSGIYSSYETTHYSQTSTVFLMDDKGGLVPYVRQIDGSRPGDGPFEFDKAKNKLMSEKEALAAFIGSEMFERLETFAKKTGSRIQEKRRLYENPRLLRSLTSRITSRLSATFFLKQIFRYMVQV